VGVPLMAQVPVLALKVSPACGVPEVMLQVSGGLPLMASSGWL
jgi:hypothetical protein